MNLFGPRPVFEIVLTLYDNDQLGFQVMNLAGQHSHDDLKRILMAAARNIPAATRPPTLVLPEEEVLV